MSFIVTGSDSLPFERHSLDWSVAYTQGDREKIYLASKGIASIAPTTPYMIQFAVDAIFYGRPNEALEAYSNIDTDDDHLKDDWHFWDFYTQALHMTGNFEEELNKARQGRQLHPTRIATLLYETRALAALAREPELNKLLDECLTLPPQRGRAGVPWFQRWTPGFVMNETAITLRRHGYGDASERVTDRSLAWHNSRTTKEMKTQESRNGLAIAYYLSGQWEKARVLFEGLAADYPQDIFYWGNLGAIAARKEDRDEALRIIEKLSSREHPLGNNILEQARTAAILNEREQAMTYLIDTLKKGYGYCIFPHRNIDFQSLWDHPSFVELFRPKG